MAVTRIDDDEGDQLMDSSNADLNTSVPGDPLNADVIEDRNGYAVMSSPSRGSADSDSVQLLSSSGDSPRPSRYRGRPTGRLLLYRVLMVSICVFFCVLGVLIRFAVPLHRPVEAYKPINCPGEDLNVTTANTSTPLTNQTINATGIDLEVEDVPYSRYEGNHYSWPYGHSWPVGFS